MQPTDYDLVIVGGGLAGLSLACALRDTRLRIGLSAPPPIATLAQLPGVERVQELGGGRFRLHHASGAAPHRAVIEQSRAQGWDLWELTPESVSLEQIFFFPYFIVFRKNIFQCFFQKHTAGFLHIIGSCMK